MAPQHLDEAMLCRCTPVPNWRTASQQKEVEADSGRFGSGFDQTRFCSAGGIAARLRRGVKGFEQEGVGFDLEDRRL